MDAVNHSSCSLKEYYRHYIIGALAAAVLVHLAVFYFSPQFEFQPYAMVEDETVIVILPDEIKVPPPPEDVQQPVVEIGPMTDDDIDNLSEIPPNVYRNMSEIRTPRPSSGEEAQGFTPFDQEPILIKYVTPVYPELARNAGIEGSVLVQVLIGEDGKVIDAVVVRSDVTHAMELAAIRAALKFLFIPARQRTVPVSVRMQIPVTFELH
jgi:protein TonB